MVSGLLAGVSQRVLYKFLGIFSEFLCHTNKYTILHYTIFSGFLQVLFPFFHDFHSIFR